MIFENRYITKGVSQNIGLLLQLFMWQCIDELEIPKDYLQGFTFVTSGSKQSIIHSQENPEYKREYLLYTDAPIFIGKIFVIDDGTYTTMMLAEEY